VPLFLIPLLSGFKSVFGAMLTFFSKPPGSYIGLALIALLSVWYYGHRQYGAGYQQRVAEEISEGIKLGKDQIKIVHVLDIKYLPAETLIKWRTKYIQGKAPEYVTPKDDAACPINNGFVRLFNSAAEDTIPPSPSQSDGDASGVALSTVAATTADNFGTCHLAFSRLDEWQDWYRQNKLLWEKGK
jgi:hypothetical protein